MTTIALDTLFATFRRTGDARALADVFDRTAPELGRIASYLAGGDARLAEDLLQSTWLTAMTHAARWDDTRPLLPWLLGVLANHARNQRRAARRGSTATADALGDLLATDDPVRATEDAELQRLLAQALAVMPSPFREAVALHVQHGLTAKEIGEALGRPAGTVRTQIVRGLDRLRELLPRGLALAGLGVLALGSDAIARVRTDVLARLPAVPPVPASAAWRWGIAIAAIVAIGAAPLLLQATDAPVSAPLASAATPAVAAAATDDGRETSRELIAVAQDPAPAAPVAKPRRRLTVHVRHADEPRVQPGEFVGLMSDGAEVRFLTANSAGDVVFEDIEPRIGHQVFVSGTNARDVLTPQRSPREAELDREITLNVEHAPVLTVRVVDASGRPVAGADVEGNGSQYSDRRWCPLGVTDERGELRLRGQRDDAQLRARAPGNGPSPWARADDAGDAMLCTLKLSIAASPLRGCVVDENGKQIAAELGTVAFGAGLEEPWFDTTAADGTFTFDWLPPGHVAIVARVRTEGRARHGLLRVDVPVPGDVEVRLVRGAGVSGAVRLATGEPIAGQMLRVRMLADGINRLPFCNIDDRTGAGGAFRYDGLLPGRWLLTAEAGQARVTETIDLRDGADATWSPVVPAAREFQVRLRDERGEPLVGWRVQPCDAQQESKGMCGITGEDGVTLAHAQWRWPTDEPLVLAVIDPAGYAKSPYFPVLFVPGVTPDGGVIDVVVPDRCRTNRHVRGRIVDGDGQPLAATVYVASPRAWWDPQHVVAAGGDGAFTSGPFPPGRVRVWIAAEGLPELRLGDVDVPADGDLDLGALRMARGVAVRAACETAAPNDLRVQLVPGRGEAIALRRDGNAFVHDRVPAGEYSLRGSAGTHFVPPQPVVVGRAAQRIVFRCEPAPVLRIAVDLRDDERAQIGWSGTVTVVDAAGQAVVTRRYEPRFRGRVPAQVSLSLAVPPGRYVVKLDRSWQRSRSTPCEVTGAGGGVTFGP